MRKPNIISFALTTSLAILAGCSSHASTASVSDSALRAAVTEGTTPVRAPAQQLAHKPLPFALLGVHFDGRARAAITARLEKAGLQPATPDSPWCDWFHQGRAGAKLPGVGVVKVFYTAAGQWAETDIIYPGDPSFTNGPEGQAPGLQALAHDVTAKYGTPATTQGNAEVGPVEMFRRVAGGGEVVVQRDFPVPTLTLAMIDVTRKGEMMSEAQAAARAEQAARSKTPNPLD